MKIKMVVDQIVSDGPRRLVGGEEYELPDGLAQYLIERGMAEDITPRASKKAAKAKKAEE